jgi:hypothetical protein
MPPLPLYIDPACGALGLIIDVLSEDSRLYWLRTVPGCSTPGSHSLKEGNGISGIHVDPWLNSLRAAPCLDMVYCVT